jgi:hypothetical protein
MQRNLPQGGARPRRERGDLVGRDAKAWSPRDAETVGSNQTTPHLRRRAQADMPDLAHGRRPRSGEIDLGDAGDRAKVVDMRKPVQRKALAP